MSFADDILSGPVMADRLDVSSAQELLRVADTAVRAQIVDQALSGELGIPVLALVQLNRNRATREGM